MSDPTHEVAEEMTEDDVKFRVEMMLKGEAHNEGSPRPYSAWHPVPNSNITKFLSDPPVDKTHMLQKRSPELTAEEMEAIVAAAHGKGNDDAHSFIVIPRSAESMQLELSNPVPAEPAGNLLATTTGMTTRGIAGRGHIKAKVTKPSVSRRQRSPRGAVKRGHISSESEDTPSKRSKRPSRDSDVSPQPDVNVDCNEPEDGEEDVEGSPLIYRERRSKRRHEQSSMIPGAPTSPLIENADELILDNTSLDQIIQDVCQIPFVSVGLDDNTVLSQNINKGDELPGASPRESPRIEGLNEQGPEPEEAPQLPIGEPHTGASSPIDANAETAESIQAGTATTPPSKDWHEALTGVDTTKSTDQAPLESGSAPGAKVMEEPNVATTPDPNIAVATGGALIPKVSASIVDTNEPSPQRRTPDIPSSSEVPSGPLLATANLGDATLQLALPNVPAPLLSTVDNMMSIFQSGLREAGIIRERIAAASSHDMVILRQQLADSEASRKAEARAAAEEIKRLKETAASREVDYRNLVADRDRIRDSAINLQKQLDIEKNKHQVEVQQKVDECNHLQVELKTMQKSRDGFEKSFRDTASSLETLKTSHALTLEDLKSKNAELTEIQSSFEETRKALAGTKESLKKSNNEIIKQSQLVSSLKENYDIIRKNCDKLKDGYEKAKRAALATNDTLTRVLDLCAQEGGVARSLRDRLGTLTEDLKAQVRTKVKVLLA